MVFKFSQSHAKVEAVEGTFEDPEPGTFVLAGGPAGSPIPRALVLLN